MRLRKDETRAKTGKSNSLADNTPHLQIQGKSSDMAALLFYTSHVMLSAGRDSKRKQSTKKRRSTTSHAYCMTCKKHRASIQPIEPPSTSPNGWHRIPHLPAAARARKNNRAPCVEGAINIVNTPIAPSLHPRCLLPSRPRSRPRSDCFFQRRDIQVSSLFTLSQTQTSRAPHGTPLGGPAKTHSRRWTYR